MEKLETNFDHSVIETFANNDYVILKPHEIDFFSEELTERQEVFNYRDYLTQHRPPIPVLDSMPIAGDRCLDMPIRLAGGTEYRLPSNWLALRSTLEELISIEHAHNSNWIEYNTYLTVDVKNVTRNEQQRHGGLHVDGFQGERIKKKTKVTRNYVGTTNGGTRFYDQPFKVIDPKKFNVFQGFDLQVNSEPVIASPNKFYFMDAYMVHESGYAEENGERVFVRLTYDLRKFDRLGNTRNPNFNYNWEMKERNVWDTVRTPTLKDVEMNKVQEILFKELW